MDIIGDLNATKENSVTIEEVNQELSEMEVFLILFIFVLGGCKQQLTLVNLSNSICKKQMQVSNDTSFIKWLQIYREKSDMLERLRYSTVNDTVFALEQPGIQGDLNLTYWNKVDTVSYTLVSDSLVYVEDEDDPGFFKYMMTLVSQWNIPKIREEEKANTPPLPDDLIYATRIIIRKNRYKVECVTFHDFYNLKRDAN